MVSKNEKSPDDSERSEKNMCTGEEKDVQAGKSYLLQVPVKKIPYETGANTPGSSPQAGKDTGADTDNILQEALKDETAGNENDFNKIAKNENEEDGDAQNENTHLPEMKVKVETRKTKHSGISAR